MTDPIREILLPRLEGVRKQGGYWMARCPGHEDGVASLSISEGREHPVLLNCHAGCDPARILAAIGLDWDAVCAGRGNGAEGEWTPFGPATAVYDYTDEDGRLLFQVLRAPGKRFVQRRPDSSHKSGWAYQLGETRRVLYRLPKVLAARDECRIIYVAEGEKDVHALEAAGEVATCNPGGAGKWRPEYAEPLREAIVFVIADKDDPGYAHARQVAAMLKGVAGAVEILEAAEGKDPADHLAAGLTVAEFVRIWSDSDPPADLAPDLVAFVAVTDPPPVFALGDLLELGDRMMLTGQEGGGKSTLLRQLGIGAAAGLHPFGFYPIERRRVLHIDCENRERQSRREFRPLVAKAAQVGFPLGEGMYRLICRPQGFDLGTDDGRAWLLERVTAHQPEVLIMGSLWHMHTGDLNEEANARVLVEAVNAAADRAGCAVIIECHSPHGDGKVRPVRPAGSRLFLAWPDIGLSLQPVERRGKDGADEDPSKYTLRRWRGTRDRSQRWPRRLIVSGLEDGWPWVTEPDGWG